MSKEKRQKLGAQAITERKGGPKLTMLAAYDFLTARLIEAAGVDVILVGDSLGMVVLGYESTVPVTVEDIIHHTRAVVRGAPNTHIVADMPFLSYHVSDAQAIENAGRLIQHGGADSVKLEGGRRIADRVRAIVNAGIPVMGHVGLTPQTAGGPAGFRVQGRDLPSARAIVEDAEAVAAAGVFSIVVEAIPAELGRIITARVDVPTIGIGAGADCDGQVLVSADLLGLDDRVSLKFAKRYVELAPVIDQAFASYVQEVQAGAFPAQEQSFTMKPEVLQALEDSLKSDNPD
ncbi:MAG: 3-methyl-2-oxobutanoate hydroxymethyltransferase [Thermomicrobiales bacterium]